MEVVREAYNKTLVWTTPCPTIYFCLDKINIMLDAASSNKCLMFLLHYQKMYLRC